MTRQRTLVAASAGLLMAIMFSFFMKETNRIEANNGPFSTIGRSGDFKSLGGTPEASERRL
jgi:hypothetical protein